MSDPDSSRTADGISPGSRADFSSRALEEFRSMSDNPRNGIIVTALEVDPSAGTLKVEFESRTKAGSYVEVVHDLPGYMLGWGVTTPEGLADCLYGELEEVALAGE